MSDIELVLTPAPGLTVPVPWSANDRIHRLEQNRLHAVWLGTTHYHLIRWLKLDPFRNPPHGLFGIVQISITFDKKRTRDPHNYCSTVLKAVIDGLKDQTAPNPKRGGPRILTSRGLWPDDSPEYVGHREPLIVVADEPPRVFITFD